MPESFLTQELSGKTIDVADEDALREIAQRYVVSPLAVTIRLVEFGLTDGRPGLA